MLECLLAGDSIAIGLGRALNEGRPVCAVEARVGARSDALPGQIMRWGARPVTILSAGSNDPRNPALARNLIRARLAIGPWRVIWLLPYDRRAAYTVSLVAFRFGDQLVDLARFASADHVHPARYEEVAATLR